MEMFQKSHSQNCNFYDDCTVLMFKVFQSRFDLPFSYAEISLDFGESTKIVGKCMGLVYENQFAIGSLYFDGKAINALYNDTIPFLYHEVVGVFLKKSEKIIVN